MSEYKIIDISGWNTNVPYHTFASQGIKGAILRVTEKGNKVDSMFETHLSGCQKNNIPVGVYKYSYAMSMADIKNEAKKVVETLNGRTCPLGVWLDLEYDQQRRLSKDTLTGMVKAFRKIIVDAGYKFGIYAGAYWYSAILDNKNMPYDYWLASYPSNDVGQIVERLRPSYGQVGWQFSSKYNMNGAHYDMSVFDSDYIDKRLKGTTQQKTAAPKATTASTAALTIEKAISFMEKIAKDDSHGYDQIYRWNERGDYDCSSLTITAWQQAGVPVKTHGATYTGNMYDVFTKLGFKDVTASVRLSTGVGLKRGDVLLNHVHHVAMYCGGGKEVEASINERGGATGGQPGDQTGREILIRDYRNYPWNAVLRYDPDGKETTSSTLLLKKGSTGGNVSDLQTKLNKLGYGLEVDGEFGIRTYLAVTDFQKKYNLEVDGIVGPETFNKLKSLVNVSKPASGDKKEKVEKRLYVAKVSAAKLNVRSGAGTGYAQIKEWPLLNRGNLVDVYKEIQNASGEKWLYIKIADKYFGYVSAKYMKKV